MLSSLTTKRFLLIVALSNSIVSTALAQTPPYSCSPGFEVLIANDQIQPELKAWIALKARNSVAWSAEYLWRKYSRADFPCADLSCVSDEEILTRVGKRCSAKPRQTLEQAAAQAATEIKTIRTISEFCQHLRSQDADCVSKLGRAMLDAD